MSLKSRANIMKITEEEHKPLPSFEWRGPLEKYYSDGECYYTKYYTVATCSISGDTSDYIHGNHDGSIKRALASLSESCSCGARWAYNKN
jgi:hypothetical protein